MSEGEGSEQQQKHCTNCGAPVRPGTSFCVSCGKQIEEKEQYVQVNAPPMIGGSSSRTRNPLSQENVRLVLFGVGMLLFLIVAYLLLSFSVLLGVLVIVLLVLTVLIVRKNRGFQTNFEQRLFEAGGRYGQSAHRAYEEGKHRELAQSAYQQSKRAYEEANTRYQRWSEEQAVERERNEVLRRTERERSELRARFDRYRRFFERANQGSRTSLDWWRVYDTGEFDDEQPPVSDLLLSAQERAERGLNRLREVESAFSNSLEQEDFKNAGLLLDGVRSGQENVESKESVFAPLVVVHERIKESEDWDNYREELERFIKGLEDLLESPNVRTAAANRVRFPSPNRPRSSDPERAHFPDPHTSEQTRRSRICQRCGAENALEATFCHNCGTNLQVDAVTTGQRNSGAVIAGYVFASLSFLILPPIFIPVAILLGILNIAQGKTGHGVAQILIAAGAVLFVLILLFVFDVFLWI